MSRSNSGYCRWSWEGGTMHLMSWRGDFPGESVQLAKVRRLASVLLQDFRVRDDAISCLVELASNAIVHTRSAHGFFTVGIWSAGTVVRVAVKDAGGWQEPVLRSGKQKQLAEGGRGLAIVVALAERLGIAGDEDGRVVWADLKGEGEGEDAGPAGSGATLREAGSLLEPACERCWPLSGCPSQIVFSAVPAERATNRG